MLVNGIRANVSVDSAGNEIVQPAAKKKGAVVSASGLNAFIAAVPAKKIRVLGYRIQAQGTVTVTFQDTTPAAVADAPTYMFQAREGIVATSPPGAFEFETPSGLGLQINLSAAVSVSVVILYVEVP